MSDQYNEFFSRANSSAAFSKYCTKVYGIDLTQDGFSDRQELDLMIFAARISATDTVLDIGSGNGKIDQYIHSETSAKVIGIDYSISAIEYANSLSTEGLYFLNGDINALNLDREYDVIILIDSIYFSNNYDLALGHLYDHLAAGGRLVLMYSEFIFDRNQQRRLLPQDTKIADVIERNSWKFGCEDLTENLYRLMRRKRNASEELRIELESEGNGWLYRKVHDESIDLSMTYSDFEKFTNRFIYCIEKSETEHSGT
jgi:SAM-dependent methyltransferase